MWWRARDRSKPAHNNATHWQTREDSAVLVNRERQPVLHVHVHVHVALAAVTNSHLYSMNLTHQYMYCTYMYTYMYFQTYNDHSNIYTLLGVITLYMCIEQCSNILNFSKREAAGQVCITRDLQRGRRLTRSIYI